MDNWLTGIHTTQHHTKHMQVRPPRGAGGDPTRLRLPARPDRRGAGPEREGHRGGGQGVISFGHSVGAGVYIWMDGWMCVKKSSNESKNFMNKATDTHEQHSSAHAVVEARALASSPSGAFESFYGSPSTGSCQSIRVNWAVDWHAGLQNRSRAAAIRGAQTAVEQVHI